MRTMAVVVMILAVGMTAAAEPKEPAQLEPLKFLLGEWDAGANTGPHGQGSGTSLLRSEAGTRQRCW